jgi:hypothetical protein
VHGSNARNLSVYLSISQTNKNSMPFLLLLNVFTSTKLEKRAKQVLPGREGGWRGRKRQGARGEKWPKQCMHI